LGDVFRINEAFLQLAPVDLSFGAGLSIGANFDNNGWLNFSGLGEIAPPATFGLVVYMEDGSVWKKPFGLNGVEISQLGLDVGADVLSPLPRPKLGLRGALKIGPFTGEAAGMINTANPLESLISMKMNALGLQQFINAFLADQVKREVNRLPATFRESGLKDVEITIVPKPLTMAGRQYNPGLRIKGQGQLAGLAARLDINATYDNGLAGVAAVGPIFLQDGGTTIFQLSGVNGQDSLRFATDLTLNNLLNPVNPLLLVDGKIVLLGITSQAKVEVSRNGFYFALDGNLFGKFQAKLDAKGGNLVNSQDFYIRAAMNNDLITYLNREATTAIDQATKDSQNAYRKAKEDLRSAEDYLRTTQSDVDAFNRQKAKVDAAQADVDRMNNDVNKAKRDCDKAPWYRKADKCAKYAALKASKETAEGVLSGYRKTLDGLSKAVDWSKRNIAANTVSASRTVVGGFETATTGSMKAAKWIVDKGLGGLVDVKSAEFEGQLSGIKGGQVSMRVNVKFLNENFNAGLGFNFSDPLSAAKDLATALLNDRAPKGLSAQMGGNIGTGYVRR
jgi:hypothetical protein